ncbi:unnamed protein product [Sphagnum tenellum]
MTTVRVADLSGGSCFMSSERMRYRSVLLLTSRQLPTVLAAIELDGIVKRLLLGTPDIIPHLDAILVEGEVDIIITDGSFDLDEFKHPLMICYDKIVSPGHSDVNRVVDTEWVIFTSGTTGRPKMVVHTLESLIGPLNDGTATDSNAVWATFYDVRRYGGLQILLRALIGGGTMVLSSTKEMVSDFLIRLVENQVTHISGTPSHWRRALLSNKATLFSPRYVRLSGEVADQTILDRLRTTYPNAQIAHAFASTEAGVAFDVRDGLAGFPIAFLKASNHLGVDMRVEDGTLRIRSSRTSSGYIGRQHSIHIDCQLSTRDGFVDTGDLVEQRGDRLYFVGRKEGVINVGGQKVYPEEIESIICQHPKVKMARVWARKNPITGAVVAADLVLDTNNSESFATIRDVVLANCRAKLAPYKVPASLKQVDTIEMNAAGKIKRA